MRGILLLAALALAGCDNQADKAIVSAQELLRSTLLDPDSAQFREATFNPATKTVCGQVNSKNRLGGYVGFTPFYVVNEAVRIEPDPSYVSLGDFEREEHERAVSSFASMWDELCLKQG